MKKRILQNLAVLGVNIAVAFLAWLAFVLFLFREDPILAAVPAVFALPGIIVQPWFILFALLPSGLLLAPVLTTVVTMSLYTVLDRQNKLERLKPVLIRLKSRKAGTIGFVLILLGFVIGVARYVDFPALYPGIPRTLTYMTQDLDLALSQPRYYCISSFIDSEWLWQTGLSESDLDRLAGKLGLQPLDARRIGDAYQHMPPYWWNPVITAETRVLATPEFSIDGRGPDGWHAIATWNPDDQVLHMWIKDNF